jgi:hypothetical protein
MKISNSFRHQKFLLMFQNLLSLCSDHNSLFTYMETHQQQEEEEEEESIDNLFNENQIENKDPHDQYINNPNSQKQDPLEYWKFKANRLGNSIEAVIIIIFYFHFILLFIYFYFSHFSDFIFTDALIGR